MLKQIKRLNLTYLKLKVILSQCYILNILSIFRPYKYIWNFLLLYDIDFIELEVYDLECDLINKAVCEFH